MVALIITASILTLIAVILLTPVRLGFSCRDGDMTAVVNYFFIKIDLSPDALAKRAEKKPTKKGDGAQGAGESDKEAKEDGKASDTVKMVVSLIRASKKAVDVIRKHLVFYKTSVYVSVSCADPYQTGICFSAVSAFIHAILALVGGIFVLKLKPRDICIAPDFLRGESRYDISFRVRIRLLFLLWAGGDVALNFIKIKNGDKGKRQKIKGGKKHEPTAAASH